MLFESWITFYLEQKVDRKMYGKATAKVHCDFFMHQCFCFVPLVGNTKSNCLAKCTINHIGLKSIQDTMNIGSLAFSLGIIHIAHGGH